MLKKLQKSFFHTIFTSGLLFSCLGYSMTGLAASGLQARVVGVQFADPPFPGDFMRSVAGIKDPGGKVTVFVKNGGAKIISFDKNATQATLKTTKVGLKGQKTPVTADQVKVGFFAKIAKDSQSMMVDLNYQFLPRSNQVRLVETLGKIVMTTATSQVLVDQKNLALKSGSILRLGPVIMKVKKTGKPRWGKQPLEVTFDTDGQFDKLAEIRFFDLQGNEIKSSRGSKMSMSMAGHKMVQVSYRLAQKVDKVSVKAKYWKGLATVQVPLSIKLRPMF